MKDVIAAADRALLMGERDRIKPLQPPLRRASTWSDREICRLLTACSSPGADLERGWRRLGSTRRHKAARQ